MSLVAFLKISINHVIKSLSDCFKRLLCVILHKFAQFLKDRFFHAAPVLAGPGRPEQSAQKEVGLARWRGGGASARKGGQAGGISFAIRRLPGAHADG